VSLANDFGQTECAFPREYNVQPQILHCFTHSTKCICKVK